MADPTAVVRLNHSDRAGTGLEEWGAIDPNLLASGTPVQRGALCDKDGETGYRVGVWDCTALEEKPGPYSVDEFMLLLEGTVVLAMPDGTEMTVRAGEAFVIPKGLQLQWKMPDYVRKVFMIVDDPAPEGSVGDAGLGRISVPDLSGPISGAGPFETTETWFANASGRMSVTVSHHAGGRSPAAAEPAHLLVHVLEGALTLAGEGDNAEFSPGETAYIRAGTRLSRSHAPGTRLLTARYRAA